MPAALVASTVRAGFPTTLPTNHLPAERLQTKSYRGEMLNLRPKAEPAPTHRELRRAAARRRGGRRGGRPRAGLRGDRVAAWLVASPPRRDGSGRDGSGRREWSKGWPRPRPRRARPRPGPGPRCGGSRAKEAPVPGCSGVRPSGAHFLNGMGWDGIG